MKELCRNEKAKSEGDYNVKDVRERERVETYLKRRRKQSLIVRVLSLIFVLSTVIGGYFIFLSFESSGEAKPVKKRTHFKTVYYDQSKWEQLKVDYYKFGSKAAETRIKNGRKHQNSESYYLTGEQFRSALYYYDTLIVDYYFYKNGDTIQNFPKLRDDQVYNLTIMRNDSSKVHLQYFDGKVIKDSYWVEKK